MRRVLCSCEVGFASDLPFLPKLTHSRVHLAVSFTYLVYLRLKMKSSENFLSPQIIASTEQTVFFCSLYDLANVVPTLAKFYHQASEAYEQACTRHISMIIYYVSNPGPFNLIS